MKERILVVFVFALLASGALPSLAAPDPSSPGLITAPIVNGLLTSDFPSAGLFVGNGVCTGTLIGCQTVLTAAHCVCTDSSQQTLPGSQCQQRPDLLDPSTKAVFFQHAGAFGVSSVTVHPSFQFKKTSDLAILRLSSPVTGIAPMPINTVGRLPFGTLGVIAGFGTTRRSLHDTGLKRAGQVATGPCTPDVDASRHVCWSFVQPVGAPGTDSDTCAGDSGGPLFVSLAGTPVLAGVTSGGTSQECVTPDDSYDADVFLDTAWIQSQAGADLGSNACGLPAAGTSNAPFVSAVGTLDASHPEFNTTLTIPPGASRLRVALNAEHFDTNDFDLALAEGSPVTPTHADCVSDGPLGLEFCEVASPGAGTWHLQASRSAGAGPFQITATVFSSGTSSGPCVRDASTACLQSGRFEVKVDWRTSANQGSGQVMSFGGQRTESDESVFWWFFNASNFEMGVKVLNACGLNGKYWVFLSGLTDQGWTVHVRDTQTGAAKTYSNAAGHLSSTLADTAALNCQ